MLWIFMVIMVIWFLASPFISKSPAIPLSLCFLSYILTVLICTSTVTEERLAQSYELVPFQDKLQNVYIVDTAENYCLRYKDGDETKRSTISVEELTVHEDDNHIPKIQEYKTYKKPKLDEKICDFLTFGLVKAVETGKHRYEVFVPENAVVENYTLDAK